MFHVERAARRPYRESFDGDLEGVLLRGSVRHRICDFVEQFRVAKEKDFHTARHNPQCLRPCMGGSTRSPQERVLLHKPLPLPVLFAADTLQSIYSSRL